MERKILNACYISRDAWEHVSSIYTEGDFGIEGDILFTQISAFYDKDQEAQQVDPEIFDTRLAANHPKHADLFRSIVGGFREGVSVPNILQEYHNLKRAHAAEMVAAAVQAGQKLEAVDELIQRYLSVTEISDPDSEEDTFEGLDAGILMEKHAQENLIEIRPKALNERVGNRVPRGTHIVIFARPEVGKSLFTINMAAGFLRQGLRTLYVGNEDPAEAMLMRFASNLSGRTKEEILRDPIAAVEIANRNGGENLVFKAPAGGNFREIHRWCKAYKPDCLVIDQLRNINTGQENQVVALDMAARQARNLGKKYGMVVVSVTQAGDSAEGKLVLNMGDVDFSNTGIPAAADVLIGIGMNAEYYRESRRMVSLCKNKPGNNHDSFIIGVSHDLSRVF